MCRQLIILLALIDFVYLHNKFAVTQQWGLTYNPNNILSEYMIQSLYEYSRIHYNIFYFCIITICFFSLFKNSMQITKLLGYSISIFIISFSTQIGLNILSFHEYTTFAFFIVNHPIPIELKIQYFSVQMELLFQKNLGDILIQENNRDYYCTNLKRILSNINLNQTLRTMSPLEISKYAKNLFEKLL